MDSIIGKGIYESIDELLDSFHAAAACSDLARYFGCFSSSGSFLGTDSSENWTVREFYAFSEPYFMRSTSAWTYIPIRGSRRIQYVPTHPTSTSQALFASFDELLDSPSFLCTCRGSGSVLYNEELKSWQIFSYHLTFPIPNDIAKKMCADIATFEKRIKMKHLDEEANKAAQQLLEELDLEETKKAAKTKKSKKK